MRVCRAGSRRVFGQAQNATGGPLRPRLHPRSANVAHAAAHDARLRQAAWLEHRHGGARRRLRRQHAAAGFADCVRHCLADNVSCLLICMPAIYGDVNVVRDVAGVVVRRRGRGCTRGLRRRKATLFLRSLR
jgi:hypothetical protein